jgi:general secretion pathway protein E
LAVSAVGGRKPQDFSLDFVLTALVQGRALTPDQANEIAAREVQAKARVVKNSGLEKYEVSPVEIVAAFAMPKLDQDKLSELVSVAAKIGYRKIDPLKLDLGALTRIISRPYAQKNVILPLAVEGGALVVAVANPFSPELFQDLQRLAGMPIIPVLSAKSDILKGIADVYGFRKTLAAAASDFASDASSIGNFEQLVQLSSGQQLDASDKPVVQAVDYLLRYGFDNRASDIHIEPKRDKALVRFRIDGVLHNVYQLPLQVHAPVVSRVKMISRIDISEKRKPQDGRIKIDRDGREVELRVSTLPTAFGEKVVMRIFDPEALATDLSTLGFDPLERQIFESWIAQPHGLILVTGPTGSGKTTTLYSALKALSGPDVNVTTIEDPIEMVWDAFNQVQVQPKLGLDFAAALRHILRQDPDIIMVGEIRDPETAENAIQSALTGHLVLSTLHTNDSVGAIGRLTDLEVPPFLLASSLLGVMAQRLLRKICSHCTESVMLAPAEIEALQCPLPLLEGGINSARGKGCVKCRGTGYLGRTGVFELFSANSEVRQLVSSGGSSEALTAAARRAGLRSLREAAVLKLAQGLTSFEEVLRMTTAAQW